MGGRKVTYATAAALPRPGRSERAGSERQRPRFAQSNAWIYQRTGGLLPWSSGGSASPGGACSDVGGMLLALSSQGTSGGNKVTWTTTRRRWKRDVHASRAPWVYSAWTTGQRVEGLSGMQPSGRIKEGRGCTPHWSLPCLGCGTGGSRDSCLFLSYWGFCTFRGGTKMLRDLSPGEFQ